MTKLRVLIVDDHPMMRAALRAAVDAEPDLEVVGEAANGRQAVQQFRALRPAVTVMDLYLPSQDGLQATAEIVAADPAARILMLTSATEDSKVKVALQAGALGYVLKDAPPEEFLDGLREVASGRLFLPAAVAAKLAASLRPDRHAQADLSQLALPALTPREREVLALLGEGLSNAAIAERLSLSESTVRVHLFHLLRKLNLEDRNQAIVYALKTKPSEGPAPNSPVALTPK
jgi:RNA polymerase sigma factor (sigma-70 family)